MSDRISSEQVEFLWQENLYLASIREQQLHDSPPIQPVDIRRFPLARYRPLGRLLDQSEVKYMGASREKRAAMALAYWRELRAECVSIIRPALRNTKDFERSATCAISVTCSLAMIFLAIHLFRWRIPTLEISSTAVHRILLRLTPRAVVIEFPSRGFAR